MDIRSRKRLAMGQSSFLEKNMISFRKSVKQVTQPVIIQRNIKVQWQRLLEWGGNNINLASFLPLPTFPVTKTNKKLTKVG